MNCAGHIEHFHRGIPTKRLIGLSAVAVSATNPAVAQDGAASFEGLHFSLGATIASTSFSGMAEASAFDGKSSSAGPTEFSFTELGDGEITLGFGYDQAIGANQILGVRGIARFGSAGGFEGSYYDSSGGKDEGGDLSFFGEIERSFELSARLGTMATDSVLVYGSLGASLAHYSIGGGFALECCGSYDWSDDGNVVGAVVGIGMEHMLGAGSSIGAEITYTNYHEVNSGYDEIDEEGAVSFDADSTRLTVFFAHRF